MSSDKQKRISWTYVDPKQHRIVTFGGFFLCMIGLSSLLAGCLYDEDSSLFAWLISFGMVLAGIYGVIGVLLTKRRMNQGDTD